MKYSIYQVDAFTEKNFGGNPAAVVPLEKWPDEKIMQNIAMENNLAETAFFVKEGANFHIRWFTPGVEVDLCGHATLAAAFVLFNCLNSDGNEVIFNSRSGQLEVKKSENNLLTLDFPSDVFEEIKIFPELVSGFNIHPLKAYKGKTDYLLIYESEEQVKDLHPDFRLVAKLNARGVIVSSTGNEVDFVSRFFAPQCGIDEDPVTGSAHTTLAPYWSRILGKNEMTAVQISKRKGFLRCCVKGERVEISGKGKLYLKGEIFIDD